MRLFRITPQTRVLAAMSPALFVLFNWSSQWHCLGYSYGNLNDGHPNTVTEPSSYPHESEAMLVNAMFSLRLIYFIFVALASAIRWRILPQLENICAILFVAGYMLTACISFNDNKLTPPETRYQLKTNNTLRTTCIL